MDIYTIFQIITLIFSIIIHEYMHGWMANQLGDTTAKDAGRLTLNPIPHIDPIGSVILPLLMLVSGTGMIFGWAKPVPYNPYRLRDQKYGDLWVGLAGPMANVITALFFGLILRFFPFSNAVFNTLLAIIVQINLLLLVFNLIPIPPLDGSKFFLTILPERGKQIFYSLERYGIILVLLFATFAFPLISAIINFLFKIIVGI